MVSARHCALVKNLFVSDTPFLWKPIRSSLYNADMKGNKSGGSKAGKGKKKKQAGIERFVIVKKKRQYASFLLLPCCCLIFLFWSASLFTSGLHDRKSERRVLPVWTLVNTLEAWENVKAQLWSECCKWSGDSFSAWVCLCTFVCAWGERERGWERCSVCMWHYVCSRCSDLYLSFMASKEM